MFSVNNKLWLEKEPLNNLVEALVEKHNISYVAAKVLLNRGITPENSDEFFNTKLKHSMPNPYLIKDIDKAVAVTKAAVLQQEAICILGDYDVDGMSSTAILYQYLQQLKSQVNYYIPNRFSEGYGGNESSLQALLRQNPKLVIMVDNGSTSHELVAALLQQNIKVIIIDHHAIEPNMPNAHAVVNPCRLDDSSNLNYLCSAGLVFLFLVALNRELINSSFLTANDAPNLLSLLDLVALATVCDMVPLINLNRSYVKQGLQVLLQGGHIGLKALLEVLNYNSKLTTDTLGFTLGPAINAASRMGKEGLALKLLITNSQAEALKLALSLKEANSKRQEDEDLIIKSASDQLNLEKVTEDFIFLGSQNWSQGLVGIIAGRIKELHNKPTCIYSINKNDNTATASGRSVTNIDLGNIVVAARQNGLLLKGGGHSQAVGFTFDLARREEIFNFFNKNIKLQTQRKKIDNNLFIDSTLALSAINKDLIADLSLLEPFGVAFSEPLFKIAAVFISNVKAIGKYQNHLSFEVGNGVRKVKSICFKAVPSKIGDLLLNMPKKPVDIIAALKGNFYNGNIYPNLIVVDIKA